MSDKVDVIQIRKVNMLIAEVDHALHDLETSKSRLQGKTLALLNEINVLRKELGKEPITPEEFDEKSMALADDVLKNLTF